jgi:hypothetical protein
MSREKPRAINLASVLYALMALQHVMMTTVSASSRNGCRLAVLHWARLTAVDALIAQKPSNLGHNLYPSSMP